MKMKHGHNKLWRDTAHFSQEDTVPDHDMLWPPQKGLAEPAPRLVPEQSPEEAPLPAGLQSLLKESIC